MLAKSLLLTSLLLSGSAFAQSESAATIETSVSVDEKVLEYLKTHFSASYHGEFYAVRRDSLAEDKSQRGVQDLNIMHNPTLIYRPIENWQLLTTAEFKYSDKAGRSYPNNFYRGLVTLSRKNILTEKENGVKLDLGVGRRQFNTGADQNLEGKFSLASYGNNRAFGTISKTMGIANTSLFVQYLHNDYKVSDADTWKHSGEFIPTINLQITDKLSYLWNDDIIFNTAKSDDVNTSLSWSHEMNVAYLTYQWTDQFSTYYQLKYLHGEDFTDSYQSQSDSFEHYTGVTYAPNENQSYTFEIGSELASARDGRDGLSKKAQYPELALYVDLSI
jgi:hypothetical protein